MRLLRTFVVTALLSGSVLFVGVSASSAQIATSLSVGHTTITGKGLAATVVLDFECDPSLNVAFGDATVSQVSGHKVSSGTGFFVNNFPGVPCTGGAETVTVSVPTGTSFAFKHGHATVSADLSVFDPVSGILTQVTAGPETVRLGK